ncbi:peptidyl-tRNA hydrolase PTH2-domain-containing protein [Suillus clintonianus]|uniref:peptidyl-tRNA hydrolase PTH2-domain-containing protein n=1 Tax=Suillus clintonianus TaxID=1904413 RepID=UPI001B872D77|nr:peptidyl-tRNA hydrolase PTH2-domain-containing protein [Suillus clintonianus]KAG2154530.1 peptidyl-tRNA hydrolase PTH2-domain-containing protein [Suillus clintonianus]
MSPSALSHVVVAGAALGLGYYLGSRLGTQDAAPIVAPTEPPSEPKNIEPPKAEPVVDSDEEDDALADGDLGAVKAGFMQPCKLVLVVRTDLKMTSGKIAAQHATLACYKALSRTNPALVQHWERIGQAKIALKCSSEDELLELEAVAKSLNLCARSILDAGRTQIAAGSRTVLGIGPAPIDLINQVTGHLRLL